MWYIVENHQTKMGHVQIMAFLRTTDMLFLVTSLDMISYNAALKAPLEPYVKRALLLTGSVQNDMPGLY